MAICLVRLPRWGLILQAIEYFHHQIMHSHDQSLTIFLNFELTWAYVITEFPTGGLLVMGLLVYFPSTSSSLSKPS